MPQRQAKQFFGMAGAPLYWHAAKALSVSLGWRALFLFFPATALRSAHGLPADQGAQAGVAVQRGWGARRQDSVLSGFACPAPECAMCWCMMRPPFVAPDLISACLHSLRGWATALYPPCPSATPSKWCKTMRVPTPCPLKPCAVQTPQGFALAALKKAHEAAQQEQWQVTMTLRS